jgi:perosamine synthetase
MTIVRQGIHESAVTMIPVNRPLLDGNEKKYLAECIETGWISSEGPFVKLLEARFSKFMGCEHGVAVCNGSAAIDLALGALKIPKGAEVIIPSFTIISCAAAVVRAGAVPVVVDCTPDTWNLDPTLLASKINSRTKAIMVVHIYGLPVDMDPVLKIAREHGLFVIEDAAEQHGQSYNGRQVGSIGDIAIVSFYPNKHVTTGEGGMVVTNSAELADRCRQLRNLCFDPERRFVHEELGWNLRMSNLQAAVGVAQFERISDFLQKKREIGRRYQEHLRGHAALQLPVESTPYADNIYWVFGVVLGEKVPFDAGRAMALLREKGVDSRHFFWPMHQQPALKRLGYFEHEKCPNAERIARRGFYLPSGVGTTMAEVDASAAALKEILE